MTVSLSAAQPPRSIFVGRAAELAELARVAMRPPALALVEGEAGVGKTRLVRELVRRPELVGRTILVGCCQPMREPFPYGPVVDLLRDTAPLLTRVAGSLSPIVGALRPLLPELAPLLPPEPPKGDAATERHRVFRAVRELLAAYGPAVLVIDDLHWADEGTQDLLRFLMTPPTENLALVATCRRDVYGAGAWSVLEPAHRLLSGDQTALLRLRPLEPADVGVLAAGLLGTRTVGADFATSLHHRTAGIPFVIEEVLREFREIGAEPRSRTLDLVDIPVLLRDTMAERLRRLGPAVAAVVHAAAVLDTPATEDDLAAVSALPTNRVARAVTDALAGAVLFEVGTGRYALRHPLARQAVDVSIPSPQRRKLHARAAELLSARSDRVPVRLAHHYRQAGDLPNWVSRTVAAADHATEIGDTALALQVLETALADEALPTRSARTLAVRLSRAAVTGIAQVSTVERLQALLLDGLLTGTARGEVRINLGRLLMNQTGRIEEGQSELEMAVLDLADRPALAARGAAALTLPTFGWRPVPHQFDWLEKATRLAAAAPRDEELSMVVRANHLALLAGVGDRSLQPLLSQLPRTSRSPRTRRQLARAFNNVGDALAWTGHYTQARELLQVSDTLMSDNDVPYLSTLRTGTRLRIDALTGTWATLETDAAQLIEQAGEMPSLAMDAFLALAWTALARGDRDAAGWHLDGAQASAPETPPLQLAVSAARVALALARNDVAAAAVGADRALNRVRAKENWVWAADLVPHAVRAFTRAGRSADAHRLADEYTQGVAGTDAPLAAAAVVLVKALVAKDSSEALDGYRNAAAAYTALPQPHTAATIHEAAASVAVTLGDPTSALAHFTAAATGYTELGCIRDANRCRRASRRFRPARPRGRKGYGGELSPREREVVELVAAGRTNRQIADELFLSPRTVEHHVSRAMHKLNVGSRAAFQPGGLQG
ncbi:regulatory protein, luxR family [Lentzea albidocapillata subsp. violacea]|uniref:Regulatory protein, luxR family n=1 Tax=Lentzea albidocapillata subsp. violacea TaxID=128104 RepID=A0A1G8SC70_9PSEU|nr:LuxR family transcriptional regulator [Lentzea albidocapillata]SDJ26829.1 regulatory protein, luxR family [Lentzea albidocapillata subsp. violacea]